MRDLAAEVGVSKCTVRHWVKIYGLLAQARFPVRMDIAAAAAAAPTDPYPGHTDRQFPTLSPCISQTCRYRGSALRLRKRSMDSFKRQLACARDFRPESSPPPATSSKAPT